MKKVEARGGLIFGYIETFDLKEGHKESSSIKLTNPVHAYFPPLTQLPGNRINDGAKRSRPGGDGHLLCTHPGNWDLGIHALQKGREEV